MTNYVRIILGFSILGCLIGLFLFFKSDEKKTLTEKIRLDELESLSLSETSEVISKLNQLNQEDELSFKEKILLIELQLDFPETTADPKVMASLEEIDPSNPDFLILETCYLFSEGNQSALLEKLSRLTQEYPENLRAKYEYNKRAFIHLDIEGRLLAKKQLNDLARKEGRWGYKARQVLCFSPPMRGYLKEDLLASIDLLHTHPLVTSIDYLKGCELKMILDEKYQVKDFFTQIERMLGARVKSLDYATWLLKLGFPEKVLSIVSDLSATSDADAFFLRFMALLDTKKNNEATSLINRSSLILSKSEIDRADSYLKIALGDLETLKKRIKNIESSSAEHFLTLSRMALFKGLEDEARMAFDRAWRINPNRFSLSQANQYLQISLAAKQTEKAYSITKNIYSRYPFKYGNINNFCYLSLLLGINEREAQKLIDSTVQAVPNNPAFLSTLALANLLSGNPRQAMENMQKRGIPQLVHSERAILAVIFHQLGDRERGVKMAATVPKQRLLPEELKLLLEHDLVAH